MKIYSSLKGASQHITCVVFYVGVASAMVICPMAFGAANAETGDAASENGAESESAKRGFSGQAVLVTDYLWRGVSQTHRDPALQPELDFDLPLSDHTAFYAGVWGSNIKYPGYPKAHVELEYWLGLTDDLGNGRSVSLEALYYDYPQEHKLSYGEVSATLVQEFSFPLKPALSLMEAYAWDTYGTGTTSFYTDLSLKFALPAAIDLTAHYGRSRFIDEVADKDYSDWRLAVMHTFFGGDLELSYNATNARQYGHDGAGHWVLSYAHHF